MQRIPTVSVIVPIYNAELFLDRCLASVLKSTITNIEVICVDDGSTDESLKSVQAWADRDSRIMVFSQQNQGQAIARNLGITLARGKYVYFLDSDDYISPILLSRCTAVMEQWNLDVVYFDGVTFVDGDLEAMKDTATLYNNYYRRTHKYSGWFAGSVLFQLMRTNSEYRASPCMQMIRRSYLVEIGAHFDGGYIREDEMYTLQTILPASRAGCINDILYFRSIRPGSTMTSRAVEADLYAYSQCLIKTMSYMSSHEYDTETVKYVLYLVQSYRDAIIRIWNTLDSKTRTELMDSSDVSFRYVYHFMIWPRLEQLKQR